VEVSQLGDVGEHFTNHGVNGWTTSETFCWSLQSLRDEIFHDEEPIQLILDFFSAHRTAGIRNVAIGYDIELSFIPP
jgi:hypothetical protein